jgi:intracellular septation protein
LFQNVFHISEKGWSILSLRWGFFFLLLAGLNEWVRQSLTPDMWVTFKLVTIVGTIAFGVSQFILARRERLPDATPWGLVK